MEHDYPPLITPRSPSYERAQQGFFHPAARADSRVAELLAGLREAEDAASRACAEGASRLTDRSIVEQLRSRAAMHQERREGLAAMVAKLRERHAGDDPAAPPASSRWVDEVMGAQSDLAVMNALRGMREALSAAYEEAMRSPSLDPTQQTCLRTIAPSP